MQWQAAVTILQASQWSSRKRQVKFNFFHTHRLLQVCVEFQLLFENLKGDLRDEGLLARHLLNRGQGGMNTMTTMSQSFPPAKGAEVSAQLYDR